ncbi:MAG: universal stress protein [Symploca sp. SIO3C6]|uniref:Universal stress protein n=1 Tax=Symploca sp. SIO1C4 TaxID=2607765 RepID=A0A6B3N9Y4_9CYAN|nr:universal stress protein [Symploca sp. SIO3C6]NER28477.1 universal stress protein [Symploca sp. SIO1C4]NET04430.1 universal stress protein [Symploca sp. SIO2B6]NET49574.1 universal stress protein [Merismopedia sp. SIO2A8]
MFNTVLLPVDQSREAREAAEVVLHIVKKYDSRLILLSVIPESNSQSESPHPETMMSPEGVAELLQNAQALFAQNGIKAETFSRQGQPPFVICDVADEVDADLIVMGCRGLGLTEEGVADSVTNRVINLSPCPVLVVP